MIKEKLSTESVKKLIKCLNNNGIAVFPTDTVYGIGAVYNNSKGINRIYKLKQRARNKPIIALISDIRYLEKLVNIQEETLDELGEIIRNYWPGELTIVFDKSKLKISEDNTIGVRIPGDENLLKIIDLCGGIIFTTSANLSGEKSPVNIAEISEEILENVEFILDGGILKNGVPSTVIKYSDNEISILREGNIKKAEIFKLFMKKGRG